MITYIKIRGEIKRIFSPVGLLIAITLSMAILTSEAKKVTTKFKAPKVELKDTKTRIYPSDQERFASIANKLSFTAYDKKASSSKESFFITNSSDTTILGLEIEITYFSMEGSQVHRRNTKINQFLPPGETRKIDIKSWDTQHSYHYAGSSSSGKSTPYKVTLRILSFEI